jgi:hypothetical protein
VIVDLTRVAVATRESCGTALSSANHDGIARIPRIVGVGASAIPCDSTRIVRFKNSRLSIEKKQEGRTTFWARRHSANGGIWRKAKRSRLSCTFSSGHPPSANCDNWHDGSNFPRKTHVLTLRQRRLAEKGCGNGDRRSERVRGQETRAQLRMAAETRCTFKFPSGHIFNDWPGGLVSASRDSAIFFKRATWPSGHFLGQRGKLLGGTSCDLAWGRAGWRGRFLSYDGARTVFARAAIPKDGCPRMSPIPGCPAVPVIRLSALFFSARETPICTNPAWLSMHLR